MRDDPERIGELNPPDSRMLVDPRDALVGSGYDRKPVLPGDTWESGNMFNGLSLPNCDMEDAVFDDTVWRFGQPSRLDVLKLDLVFEGIYYSDPMRRLQAVEQLTLPPQYTTIPNTAAFSRFEHIWGSVLFIEQMCQQHGISGEQANRLKLRTLVSDMGHTFGSHLGDWLFQGVGGSEDQHDLDLAHYLEVTGVNDILREHGIDPADVIFPEIEDWVECGQPDLNVDRVDYALREMLRWNDVVYAQGLGSSDFHITPEGMLAMHDQQRARVFAEGYLLLSQEHWAEPTHRFLLDMYMLRTKLFYAHGKAPHTWSFDVSDEGARFIPLQEMHPRDLMFVTDSAQLREYDYPNSVGQTIDAIMKSVAQYHRQYVWPGKREQINNYMAQFGTKESYSNVIQSGAVTKLYEGDRSSLLRQYPNSLPLGISFLDEEEAQEDASHHYIDIKQPPLKLRQIDPLVRVGDRHVRLSVVDPTYQKRLSEHRDIMSKAKVARLAIPDKETRDMLRFAIEEADSHWQDRITNSRRMTDSELRGFLSSVALEVHGRYPFMTHLSY